MKKSKKKKNRRREEPLEKAESREQREERKRTVETRKSERENQIIGFLLLFVSLFYGISIMETCTANRLPVDQR